jgi:hypothetical protein
MISILVAAFIPVLIYLYWWAFWYFKKETPKCSRPVKAAITVLAIGFYAYIAIIGFPILTGTGVPTLSDTSGTLWTVHEMDSDKIYPVIGIMEGFAYYNEEGSKFQAESVSVKNAVTGADADTVRIVRLTDPTGIFYIKFPYVFLTNETAASLEASSVKPLAEAV